MSARASFLVGVVVGYIVLPRIWMEVSALISQRKG